MDDMTEFPWPRVSRIIRRPNNKKALLLVLEQEPTDAEMQRIHDFLLNYGKFK